MLFANFKLIDFSLIEINAKRFGDEISQPSKGKFEVEFQVNFDDIGDKTDNPMVSIELGMKIHGASVDEKSDTAEEIFTAESKWKAKYSVTDEAFEQLQSDDNRMEVIPDVIRSLIPLIRSRMIDLLAQLNIGHVPLPWDLTSLQKTSD